MNFDSEISRIDCMMYMFLGDDAFDDIPLVVGQLLDCLEVPACDHCGVSLVTSKLYFGTVWTELEDDMKAFAEKHWPDVSGAVCERCRREKYCGTSCREEAWERYI